MFAHHLSPPCPAPPPSPPPIGLLDPFPCSTPLPAWSYLHHSLDSRRTSCPLFPYQLSFGSYSGFPSRQPPATLFLSALISAFTLARASSRVQFVSTTIVKFYESNQSRVRQSTAKNQGARETQEKKEHRNHKHFRRNTTSHSLKAFTTALRSLQRLQESDCRFIFPEKPNGVTREEGREDQHSENSRPPTACAPRTFQTAPRAILPRSCSQRASVVVVRVRWAPRESKHVTTRSDHLSIPVQFSRSDNICDLMQIDVCSKSISELSFLFSEEIDFVA